MSVKKKVLIIDDEEDACLLLKQYFAKKNFEVTCAFTLKEGLQKIRTEKPDLVFLDNNLPDGLGWEVSACLLQENPNLEIHLISAYNNSMRDFNKMNKEVMIWQKPISFRKLDEQLSMKQAS
jgi:two-component system, OmpR family, response regulator